MLPKRTQSNESAQNQAKPDRVGLKVFISDGVRRRTAARAALDGCKMEAVVQAALDLYTSDPPSNDSELERIFKEHFGSVLFGNADALRAVKHWSWAQFAKSMAEQYVQNPKGLPAAPVPVFRSTPPRPGPKVVESGIPGCTVTVDEGWETADSGIRQAV